MIKKQFWLGNLIISVLAVIGFYSRLDQPLALAPNLIYRLGLQIWKNECGGRQEGLVTWNQGEEFASLGIGHFIWYPEDHPRHFKETFPALLSFFKSYGIHLPAWLEQAKGCPWQTKEEFQNPQNQELLQELRQLLAQHIDVQILFMVQRLQKALSVILSQVSSEKHSHFTFQFYRLAHTANGLYALIDYLNFKGEGVAQQERYQGQGWGLIQVLEQMQGIESDQSAVEEFIQSAKEILALRVEHSPPERREQRWLKGWYNRLDTYRQFSLE